MASFIVDVNAGQMQIMPDRLRFIGPRSMRLHLRARPGDTLWLVEMTGPLWVLGRMIVADILPGPSGVTAEGMPGECRWFAHARVGMMGAFVYKRTLRWPEDRSPRPSVMIRLAPGLEEEWAALLATAPQDQPSCYCGECQTFREPAKFRNGGHPICKTCRSRIHHARHGKVRRLILRDNTEQRLTAQDWAACKEFFGQACAYCGRRQVDLTRDHVVSIWQEGGEHSRQNVVPACRSCNSKKSNQDMETWYRATLFFREERLDRIRAWLAGGSPGL